MSIERLEDIYKPHAGSDLELLPCPFCGGVEVVYFRYKHLTEDRYGIMCSDCMATIDPGWAQQKFTVQAMWNRRAGRGD